MFRTLTRSSISFAVVLMAAKRAQRCPSSWISASSSPCSLCGSCCSTSVASPPSSTGRRSMLEAAALRSCACSAPRRSVMRASRSRHSAKKLLLSFRTFLNLCTIFPAASSGAGGLGPSSSGARCASTPLSSKSRSMPVHSRCARLAAKTDW